MRKFVAPRILTTLLIIATVFAISSCRNNPDTCTHDWGAPTCLEPAQCYKCDTYKADGILGNHNYSAATCREPAKCIYCNQYKDDKLGIHEFSSETGYCYYCGISRDNSNNTCVNGHTEEKWIITKNPTLISNGIEELKCGVCNKSLDSRTVQKKLPQVESDHFNFTDKEFIEWFNNKDGSYIISNTELGEYGNDSPFTSYKITFSDGKTGTIMLSHGEVDNIIDKDGYITGIYVEGDTSYAAATVVWIGKEINSKFDIDDAINNLLSDKSYISAQMYCNYIDFSDGTAIAYLEPYQ